eukprot:scaffold41682_cov104-Phaeocystis_antarctica.AAC.1
MVRAVTEPEDGSWESLPRSGIVRYEEGGRPRTAQFGTVDVERPGQPGETGETRAGTGIEKRCRAV